MGAGAAILSERPPDGRKALLVARLRTGLPLVLLSVSLFMAADWLVGHGRNVVLLAIQATQIVGILGAIAFLRTAAGRTRADGSALAIVSFVYVSTAAASVASGGPVAMSLLFILLSMGTATLLPWGARAQFLSVVVAGAATAASLALTQEPLDPRLVYETVAMVVGFIGSVHVAGELERHRTTIEERTRALAEAQALAGVGDWEWHVTRNRIRWSEQLHRIYGRGPGDVPQTIEAYLECVHPDDRGFLQDLLVKTLASGEPVRFDHRMVRPDGAVRVLYVLGEVETDDSGEIVRVFGTVQDVTERKQVEEELARARDEALEVSALKSAFLANTSHEIRTPLNIILGYSDMIGEHLGSLGDRTLDDYLEGIRRAGQRLLETIHGTLDFSKMESGAFRVRPQPLEIGPILTMHVEDCRAIARSKGLSLVLENEEPGTRLRFDEYCLSSALLNLLQNAIKFTRVGGVVVRLARDADGALVLSIRDTGIGIDAAFQRRLFEPFSQEDSGFTRQFEGSGLGLALSRKYLALNGASIHVESEKGKGSTFTIRFPPDCELPPKRAAARAAG